MPTPFNILISSAGRRVSLVRCFQNALLDIGVHGMVVSADLKPNSSACQASDAYFPAPRFTSGRFIEDMLALCQSEHIRLIIPTIDTELPYYADNVARFEAIGTAVCISSPDMIRIAGDKVDTHRWLKEHGFPTPKQGTVQDVLADPQNWPLPLIAKPRSGSSSLGLLHIDHLDHLGQLPESADSQGVLVETCAKGSEYTIDVYVDRSGKARGSVPRLRLETRGGEVSKGLTVRQPEIQQLAECIATTLPGVFGVINIQVFYDSATGELTVIEINPRFGGGYPLTHQAGAVYAQWLIEECLGLPLSAEYDTWRDGLVMLRYDDAIFVDQPTMNKHG